MKRRKEKATRVPITMASLLLILISTSCGGDPVQTVEPAAPVPAAPPSLSPEKLNPPKAPAADPLADPATPGRVVYSTDLISDPLPPSMRASVQISREEALAIAARDQDFGPDAQPGQPIAVLRLVTLKTWEYQAGTTGPHWVITWKNSKRMGTGGGGSRLSRDEREALIAQAQCVFIVVIDAQTGASKDVAQYCRDKDKPAG